VLVIELLCGDEAMRNFPHLIMNSCTRHSYSAGVVPYAAA
jgi:hypothetical protein